MEYEGYRTKQEVLELIEANFPFIEKTSDNELFVFNENDIMRKTIQLNLAEYFEPEIPYEGIMVLFDEFLLSAKKQCNGFFLQC